ncbi:hypothetical protein DSM43518_03846 [Mycobacterium marinum]|uniref:hypothetical protein n=1 Tax=Mycobacterium marinum TaxID=1781 RepID=UPI000358DFFB|nr:hypothetical protein [Mycobacterium marinum]AXN52053.1 hypothetical protein CCUG20998_04670 [Mycobacterium marinum]EPQ73942.1 Putative membrane protein [Mycobacterium marinum str. Europe]RFZ05835.1 hypothetical protein DSM43518_03846 [Mycobacterium marinum]RFZ10401.1 hypothetical protein VIMS_03452 [Mycobacterium marinum]RFZ15912.1 hypothetical protein DSM43519_05281 [Mycobacterium marinum]
MPPRELPAQTLDTEDPGAGVTGAADAAAEADLLARAQARADSARARATRLRELAEAASTDPDASAAPDEQEPTRTPTRRGRGHRHSRKALAAAGALVVICASLSASGFLLWHHHNAVAQRERAAAYSAAARNAVLTMMSIDSSKARDDVQRFVDSTTGIFKAGILMSAEDFVKAVEQSKVHIKGAVQAVAVESMTDDSAIVLIAAKSDIVKPDQTKPETRSWRIVVNVERDGTQLKISKVEFVP